MCLCHLKFLISKNDHSGSLPPITTALSLSLPSQVNVSKSHSQSGPEQPPFLSFLSPSLSDFETQYSIKTIFIKLLMMSNCVHFSRLYLIIIFTIDGKLPRTLFYWLLQHYFILVWIVSLLEGCYKNYIIHVEYVAQGCICTCQVHIGQCCYHVGNDFLSQ